MTDILCKWLNEEVRVSSEIESKNFASEFSSGYLLGEILYKHGLQADFTSFSKTNTADSKLNNFTRIEPTIALLGIPYDTNLAKDVMDEKPGVSTRLVYQLFIALGRKTKLNLTGVAMETMRPSGPAKLGEIETDLYKERLKTLVPRQVDLNFENLVKKYHGRQKEQEDEALKASMEEADKLKKYQQKTRQENIQRSRNIRDKQDETMQKIREATVKIPKPPETKKQGKNKESSYKDRVAQSVYSNINKFENSLKSMPPPMSPLDMDRSTIDTDINIFLNNGKSSLIESTAAFAKQKPALNDDYIFKIRKQLDEDSKARKEREKRRRRVLVEQLKSHEAQQEAHREEMLVNRLMRQSQMERRIAVQLMHVRHEKEVIKKNRMMREQHFTERRLKDFTDSLEKEAELCRQARLEYDNEVQQNIELHDNIAAEKARQKYSKRYNICKDMLLEVVDFACKVGEYRELTEKLLPPKLVREWKALFLEGKPLYQPELPDVVNESEEIVNVDEEKEGLLDQEDFKEYKQFSGEWETNRDAETQEPPKDNAILGHILHRMFNIVSPPEPPPPAPQFPPCPLKVCVLGKFFSGKSTAIQHLVSTHRVVSMNVDDIVEEALEAYKNKESISEEEDTETQKGLEVDAADETSAKQSTVNEAETETTINKDESMQLSVAEKLAENVEQSVSGTLTETKFPDSSSIRTESIKTIGSPHSLKSTASALMFTNRAKLGAKAFSLLKKGKPVSDTIIVDIVVDAVRNVPEGTGWILDGFPSTLNQAKLLEKALTGYDATNNNGNRSASVTKKMKKSKLVPDPHPPTESATVKSGLDLVCMFDVDDEIILRRAEGRTYDPTNADEFHQEFNSPPEGSYTGTMTQAKVQPVMDPSNDREQVQTRLSTFQDTLPKLEKWYGKFGVLHKINADKPREALHEELETIIEDTLQKLNAPQEEKNKELTDIVEQEPPPKEEPPPEVLPELVPEAPPSPVSEVKSAKSGSKVAKPSSPKSSKKGGKKEDRTSSPKSKKKARSPSAEKKDKAGKKAGRSPSPGKGSRSSSRSGSRPGSRGRKSPVKEPEVEIPPEPQGPPEPEPGSTEWEYVAEPIDDELAHVLVDQWKNIEDSYVASCKHVFRKIRLEREVIYRYMYNKRKDFAEFLKRPDAKQEFVSMWQKDYNEIAEDMRNDEDTKGEMHQRLEDLCERLWDICDTRKEEAEEERENIMKEGWLEDHLGLLTNHHISLMQGEVDRYQETSKLLKDYYVGMEGGLGQKKAKVLPEESTSFSRIPLVELPATLPPGVEPEPSLPEVKPLSAKPSKDKDREKDVKTPDQEEDDANKRRIPLVPRRPKSGDVTAAAKEIKNKKSTPRREKTIVSEEKLDSPIPPADPDERLLFDAFQAAVQAIEMQNAADLAEEEAEAQRIAELEKEREKELMKNQSKDKRGKKGGGRKSITKGSTSPGKSMVTESPVPAPTEDPDLLKEQEEKERKQKIREKSMKEYKYSVLNEGIGLRKRLDAIKFQSTSIVQELKGKAEGSYRDMDDWLGTRFLTEMGSIETMAKIAREAIEKEAKVQDAIILEDKELVIDYDLKRFKTPSPPPPPSPKEQSKSDTFAVVELLALHEQFIEVAPSGLISVRAFCDTIMDLTTCTIGTETLPDNWKSVTLNQLQDVANMLSADNEYLDWKTFLLAAAKPWPSAATNGLLDTLQQFREIDDLKIGRVGRDNFEKIKLWFSEEENELDSYAPDGYNRLKELHSAFFDIFSDFNDGWFSIDYLEMLLYFSATSDPLEGFLRALSVVTGSLLPSKDEIDAITNNTSNEEVSERSQIIPNELLTPIKLDHLLQVFNHSKRIPGDSHRFSTTTDPLDTYSEERLSAIYEELGGDEDGVPIYLLFQHPIMRDCINMFKKFEAIDLQSALKSTEPQT